MSKAIATMDNLVMKDKSGNKIRHCQADVAMMNALLEMRERDEQSK